MEHLGYPGEDQKDWNYDVDDPIEKAMVTKEKPTYGNRGQGGTFRMPRKRGRNNYNLGKKLNKNLIGRNSDIGYMSDASSNANSFFSCRSGYYGSQVRQNRRFESYDSDSMSTLTSVSCRNNSFGEKINPPNLVKILSEFKDFQASLIQLLEISQIDHNTIKKVAFDNDRTFEVKGELIFLRPKVTVCSSHLKEGCHEKEKCNNIHLCYDYIMGLCREKDCCFGHFWCTDHNKRVFKYYYLNFLNVKVMSSLFKTFLSPKDENKDLEICEQYNEGNCEDPDCPKLHLCLKFLANQCSLNKCSLNHKVLSSDVKCILQSHGISLNETPRDILFSIVKTPNIRKVVENFKVSQAGNVTGSLKKSDENTDSGNKKDAEIPSSSFAETKEAEKKVEEFVPIKTVWSHELRGDVTLNEICYNSIESHCPFEEKGCWRLHCPYHFHWQIKTLLGKKQSWVNLTEEQSFTLEKAFCDPNVLKVNLPVLGHSGSHSFDKGLLLILKGKSKWEADFDTMTLNLSDKNVCLELRRLCTEITENVTPDPCKFMWYSDINKNWIEYGNTDSTGNKELKSNLSSKDIENHFQTRPYSPLPFENQTHTYIIDMQSMTQLNLDTNAQRTVRRRPIPHLKDETEDKTSGDLPSYWEPMQPEERSRRVTLPPSSDEYKKIDNLVQSQSQENSFNILKIERVQNPFVYRAFQNKVQEMKVTYKNDSTVNVQQLFHGTHPDTVPKICGENFDWRLHGSSSGQYYGRGTYFSTLSSLSRSYARADSNGHNYMFVAKVAVGTTTTGSSGMARPPINAQYNFPYDATVDNVSNPTIIVKYDKQEYYPEYIITFG